MASIFRINFINPSDLKRIATTETFSYPKKVTTQKTNVLKFKSTPPLQRTDSNSCSLLKYLQS